MSLIDRESRGVKKFVPSYAPGEAKVVDHPRHFPSKNPSCGKHKNNGNLIMHDDTHYDCYANGMLHSARRIPIQRPTAPALGLGDDSASPNEISLTYGKRMIRAPERRPTGYGKRTNIDINKTTEPNRRIKGRKYLWYMIGGGNSRIFDDGTESLPEYHYLIRPDQRKNALSSEFAEMDCTGGRGELGQDVTSYYRFGKGVTTKPNTLVGVMAPEPIYRGKPFNSNPPFALDY